MSTFRTGDGIWTRASIDEVCNYATWQRNRPAVFRFYNERIAETREARPNAAHQLLAQWQTRWGRERVLLITQNIDDLLEEAGAQHVIHLHGDMASLRCTSCDVRFAASGRTLDPEATCPSCGEAAPVKPGVVFFNEAAPEYEKLYRVQRDMTDDDLFIAIGTSFEVVPPEMLLPPQRLTRHPRNFLVDPAPQCSGYFGVIEAQPATLGLRNLAQNVEQLMG